MSREVTVRTEVLMGTLVTIEVVRPGADEAIERVFGWFREVEQRCTRFDERSELMQLSAQTGVPVPASAILFEAVQFALSVAEETGGAFDPTIGHRMEVRGFNREHRTGQVVRTAIAPDEHVSYRDVRVDPDRPGTSRPSPRRSASSASTSSARARRTCSIRRRWRSSRRSTCSTRARAGGARFPR